LKKTFGLPAKASAEAAERLLGQVLYPRYVRTLFGVDPMGKLFDHQVLAADFDLKPIRKAVKELIASLA
jgi:hypothetical protein